MDPVECFPVLISELIFHQLPGKTILDAREVSPSWDEYIGSSLHLMKKIKIRTHWLELEDYHEKIKCLSVPSGTKYQNFRALVYHESIQEIIPIFSVPGRLWTHVHVTGMDSCLWTDLAEILKITARTTQKLKLRNFPDYSSRDVKNGDFAFENLTELSLRNIDPGLYANLFLKCRDLNFLSIYIRKEYPTDFKTVIQLIKQNKVDTLKISMKMFISLTAEKDNPLMQQKFKAFTLKNSTYYPFHPDVFKARFKKFLIFQGPTLEKISSVVDLWMGCDILNIMFLLPRLEELYIGTIRTGIHWLYFKMRRNPSIRKLSFIDINNSFSVMKLLVDSTPNLIHLELHSMNQKMMNYISANLVQLKSLKLRTIDAIDYSDRCLFTKLEKVSVYVITEDIEVLMKNIPVEERNPLVKLVLKSDYIMLN